MATKSKATAKSSSAKKSAGKVKPKATKPAAKAVKATAQKKPAKAAAKPAPAKKPAAARGPAAKPAKTGKPLPKAAARKAPAGKASTPSAGKATAKPGAARAAGASAPSPSAVVGSATMATLPLPKPAARPAQVISAKDLATAHEYLLSRSASRSEEPIVVDGKPLPTEEQLLAMSDSEYMNSAQLAFFRYRLQQMERELLSNADETTEHLRETVIVPDPADRATIEEEHALELRTRDRERKLLKKVQSSLLQIEAGEYGFCEETGDPIGIPRLLARPTATLSLEAQQRREIKQKLFGD
ncbi:MAG TPA: RNA polymerase-binding protein DksA [Burkholderiaceae bacterium]|nr:RNA polymerase-binding protein DksA [Burkholderiaceae bacterium]